MKIYACLGVQNYPNFLPLTLSETTLTVQRCLQVYPQDFNILGKKGERNYFINLVISWSFHDQLFAVETIESFWFWPIGLYMNSFDIYHNEIIKMAFKIVLIYMQTIFLNKGLNLQKHIC